MPLNIRIQWNAGTARVSECVLKTLACRGLRVGHSKLLPLSKQKPSFHGCLVAAGLATRDRGLCDRERHCLKMCFAILCLFFLDCRAYTLRCPTIEPFSCQNITAISRLLPLEFWCSEGHFAHFDLILTLFWRYFQTCFAGQTWPIFTYSDLLSGGPDLFSLISTYLVSQQGSMHGDDCRAYIHGPMIHGLQGLQAPHFSAIRNKRKIHRRASVGSQGERYEKYRCWASSTVVVNPPKGHPQNLLEFCLDFPEFSIEFVLIVWLEF